MFCSSTKKRKVTKCGNERESKERDHNEPLKSAIFFEIILSVSVIFGWGFRPICSGFLGGCGASAVSFDLRFSNIQLTTRFGDDSIYFRPNFLIDFCSWWFQVCFFFLCFRFDGLNRCIDLKKMGVVFIFLFALNLSVCVIWENLYCFLFFRFEIYWILGMILVLVCCLFSVISESI